MSNKPIKVGDLVIVISSPIPEKVGMIGTVLALKVRNLAILGPRLQARVKFPRKVRWKIAPKRSPDGTGTHGWILTTKLRPLRDDPGKDETLTWAGKPANIESLTPRVSSLLDGA